MIQINGLRLVHVNKPSYAPSSDFHLFPDLHPFGHVTTCGHFLNFTTGNPCYSRVPILAMYVYINLGTMLIISIEFFNYASVVICYC